MRTDREGRGDWRRILVNDKRQRLERALVIRSKVDAHADRYDGGVFGSPRRIKDHQAGAIAYRTILEDVALDAVPGFFRGLLRSGSDRLSARRRRPRNTYHRDHDRDDHFGENRHDRIP